MLAMFPGQGSQYVGMGKDLLGQFPDMRVVFEEAEDAAKIPIRRLCLEGPDDQLRLTEFTQPCILTLSVAIWRCLKKECGMDPDYYAGHSLGEYSALVASGKLSLSRGALLVRARGQAMQKAVPDGVGAMAAILNIPEELLKALCAQVAVETPVKTDDHKQSLVARPSVLEIVNFNSPTQLVVAGHRAAVEMLVERVTEHKGKGILLAVSAPFHSSLMEQAKLEMEPLLKETQLIKNDGKLIANVTARVEPDYQWEILAQQIASPVMWYQSIALGSALGCQTFLEIGPGKVLAGLAKRLVPRGSHIQTSEDLVALIKWLQKK